MKGLELLCVKYKCVLKERQFVSKISLKSCALLVGAPSLGVKSGSAAGKRSSIAHSVVVGRVRPCE